MKPILLKTTHNPDHSFSIEERTGLSFNFPYHFHPEYELTLIMKGYGTRFVGNNISSFDNSDLVLIGKNLPHHWHSDEIQGNEDSDLSVKAIVVKFPAEFNGVRLFDIPENYQIQQLLEAASKGIRIIGKTFYKVADLMQELLEAKGTGRLLLLLRILDEIATSHDMEMISNSDYMHNIKENEIDRMNSVYEYIIKNYLGDISLPQAALIANMHESAFCKYFKKRYNKTFIQVVSEIRIGHACRQLISNDVNVAEVCYQSGFNNLSNFTKIFRKVMSLSPKEYQKKMSAKS
jgi:AraC-like DNA-binding protein